MMEWCRLHRLDNHTRCRRHLNHRRRCRNHRGQAEEVRVVKSSTPQYITTELINTLTQTLQRQVETKASKSHSLLNLLCAQANSASYPQWDRKWVVAHGLWGEGIMCWLGRWYGCVVPRGSNCSPSRATDGCLHNVPRYHQLMPISCHFRVCKALLFESTHVRSAIASTQTLTFLPFTALIKATTSSCSYYDNNITLSRTSASSSRSIF